MSSIKDFVSETSDFIKSRAAYSSVSEVFAEIIRIYNNKVSDGNVDSVCTDISSSLAAGGSNEKHLEVLNVFFVSEDLELFLNKLNSFLLKEKTFGINMGGFTENQIHDLQINFQILSSLRRSVLAGYKNLSFKKDGYYDICLGYDQDELGVACKKIDADFFNFLKLLGMPHQPEMKSVFNNFCSNAASVMQKYKSIVVVFYVVVAAASVYIGIWSGHMFALSALSTLLFALFSVVSIYEVLFSAEPKAGSSAVVTKTPSGFELSFSSFAVEGINPPHDKDSSYMDMLKENDGISYGSDTDVSIPCGSDFDSAPSSL